MLDDLTSAIEDVKQKMQRHHEWLARNETRTRTVLIEPILNALGWDVANPDLVKIEHHTHEHTKDQVDYALCSEGKVVAVVEAKKLDETLRKHATQIVNYANYQGIKFAVLTDGNQWEMYDVFPTRQGPLNDRKLLDVKLLSMTTTTCALNLLTLWRANLPSDEHTQASQPVVEPDTSKPPPAELSRQWISFEDFDPPARTKAPYRIRFWDSSIVLVQRWRDILIECTRKVISTGHLTQVHLPLGRSNMGCYMNSTPRNPATGKNFTAPRRIDDTSFFVECHGNIQTIRGRVKHLWEFLNLSLNDLHLEYSRTEKNNQSK